jgi:hypothetical protein
MDQFLATNVWKLFPFRQGNRAWFLVLFKAYVTCVLIGFCLACILNAVEGDRWLGATIKGYGHWVRGDTALDECFWFIMTTMHGIPFGEFFGRGCPGRIIAMCCCSIGYLFVIFTMTLIMFSQLPGEKAPSLYSVGSRMVSALWPSYSVFMAIVLAIGSLVGPYVSNDHDGLNNYGTGMYWSWTVAHRVPFGDIYPDTMFGRVLTIPLACMGVLYLPYALACVAVRRVTAEQHKSIVGQLRSNPEDALGRGYVEPPDAANNASLSEFVMQDAYFREDSDEESEDDGTKARTCIVICVLLTFTLIMMVFFGGSPKDIAPQVIHVLELDLPPGIRSASDPVPSVVWAFWMHDYAMETRSLEDLQNMTDTLKVNVQAVTPSSLDQYNVTEEPFHKALDYLAPNHKLDYLRAYFMHHHGGGYLEIAKRQTNYTWQAAFDYIGDNESYWFLGTPSQQQDVPCDESTVKSEANYAWCADLPRTDRNVTYSETMIGVSQWEGYRGRCCEKVMQCYKSPSTCDVVANAVPWPRNDGYIVRRETPFTKEWLDTIHEHLDAKLPVLKVHSPPTEPCCMQKQDGYPLRFDELRGEILAPLFMKYAEHIKMDPALV